MPHIYGLDETGLNAAAVAARIALDVARPHSAEVDERARFPSESLAALSEQKFYGLCVSSEFGGMAQGPRSFAAVVEELAQACSSTAMVYVMHVTAAQAIASSTTLKDSPGILRDIAAGRHLTTLAFSESGSRSQFWAPVSQLEKAADGFTASAKKSWVTSASFADSYVSSSQMPSAGSPLESVVYLVRPKSAQGVKRGESFNGLGLRGNDSAPVTFEDIAISRDELISPLGEGAKMMLEVVLPWFSIGTAAMAHGLCRAAIAAASVHLSQTGFEHTGGKLRDLPNLRARLAEMSVRTEQSRALLGYTLGEMMQPSATTPLYVLQARLAAMQAASDVTDLAMKACGGAAFSKHLGIERLFRDARAGWVMAPTVDHLLDFVGKALTGLPLF